MLECFRLERTFELNSKLEKVRVSSHVHPERNQIDRKRKTADFLFYHGTLLETE